LMIFAELLPVPSDSKTIFFDMDAPAPRCRQTLMLV
jgi:hypothetical protein